MLWGDIREMHSPMTESVRVGQIMLWKENFFNGLRQQGFVSHSCYESKLDWQGIQANGAISNNRENVAQDGLELPTK